MLKHGISPLPTIDAGDWTANGGAGAARSVLLEDFTAIFAANDEIALGCMSVLSEMGHACPRDYSIVGIDDMPTAAFFSPPLTSVRIDFETLGEQAFELLMARIDTGDRARHTVIETELRVRQSTAQPRPS